MKNDDQTAKPRTERPLTRRQLLAVLAAFGVPPDALSQDARTAAPRSYRVVLENERVRVLEYRSRPGFSVCGQGVHYHPARVVISLTGAKYRVATAEGGVVLRDVAPGEVSFAEPVTHATEEFGGAGARTCIVELKDGNWKPSTG
jgi:beta-alanine degradation protein BauB